MYLTIFFFPQARCKQCFHLAFLSAKDKTDGIWQSITAVCRFSGGTDKMIAIYAQEPYEKMDAISTEKQINLCLRGCTGEYTPFIDNVCTGKKNVKPSFNQLIKAVERGEIEKIVVYSLENIVHSLTEFSHMWEVLLANRTEFFAVKENFDTSTPTGQAILKIIMTFAQIERKNIAQRIKNNYRERAERGVYPGGPAPFGFDIGRTAMDGKPVSILTPNDKISVVKKIFELYAKGNISLGKLASYLHEEGIPGINRTGWDNVSISRILHNPVYVKADAGIYSYFKRKGIVIFNDIEKFNGEKGCWLLGKRTQDMDIPEQTGEILVTACHDGIINSETFLKCQQRLDANKRLKSTGNGAYTWLAGLVKCGYCGYSMQAVSANCGRYIYLICTGKTNFKVCDAKFRSPHVDAIEPIVADKINEKLRELNSVKTREKYSGTELEGLRSELAETEKEISNLMDGLAGANGVSAGYINSRIAELDTKKCNLVNSIKNMLECHRSIELPDCDFSTLPFEQKKSLAKILIRKVCLTNGHVDIDWCKV